MYKDISVGLENWWSICSCYNGPRFLDELFLKNYDCSNLAIGPLEKFSPGIMQILEFVMGIALCTRTLLSYIVGFV